MKVIEIKTQLHEHIEYLSDAQLKKLHNIISKEFVIKAKQESLKERPIGSMQGMLVYMADGFDEPLDAFKDYMPDNESYT